MGVHVASISSHRCQRRARSSPCAARAATFRRPSAAAARLGHLLRLHRRRGVLRRHRLRRRITEPWVPADAADLGLAVRLTTPTAAPTTATSLHDPAKTLSASGKASLGRSAVRPCPAVIAIGSAPVDGYGRGDVGGVLAVATKRHARLPGLIPVGSGGAPCLARSGEGRLAEMFVFAWCRRLTA